MCARALVRFNGAAEFVDGRSLVTPECLERLVGNLAVAKFPEEEADVALHLFFQRYVRAAEEDGRRAKVQH